MGEKKPVKTPEPELIIAPDDAKSVALALPDVVSRIRDHVTSVCKKVDDDERQKLRPLFDDDELWRKLEDFKTTALCLSVAMLPKDREIRNATEKRTWGELSEIELSPSDRYVAWAFFWPETGRKQREYLSSLATKLISEVQQKFRDEYKESLAKMAAALSRRRGVPADALDQLVNAIAPRLALENFAQHCWPELPDGDKRSLWSYLQTEVNRVEAEMNRFKEQALEGAPRAWEYAIADFKRLLAKSDPREVFKKGLIEQLLKLVESHKRQRRTQVEIERDARKKRYEEARRRFPEFLAAHKNERDALHALILYLKEPGYSRRREAMSNRRIQARYRKALGELWPRTRKNFKRKKVIKRNRVKRP
jgi:hypothetical protein